MLYLPNVTLISVRGGGDVLYRFVNAFRYSMREIEFGKVKFLSNLPIAGLDPTRKIEHISIPEMGLEGYNRFMVQELGKYIDTEFCLVIQSDGFVIFPELWDERFLHYDYIGACWPDPNRNCCLVGNGGFSIRSRKLLEACQEAPFPILENEDAYICNTYRRYFEGRGCTFAPDTLAVKFSVEAPTHLTHDRIEPTFGFHSFGWDKGAYSFLLDMME